MPVCGTQLKSEGQVTDLYAPTSVRSDGEVDATSTAGEAKLPHAVEAARFRQTLMMGKAMVGMQKLMGKSPSSRLATRDLEKRMEPRRR